MRFEYRDWVLGIDPHNLIFVDESGLNLGITRTYGRAKRGERLGLNLVKTGNRQLKILRFKQINSKHGCPFLPG